MTGLSEIIGEGWPAPWLLRTKEVEGLAAPARTVTLPEKASADLDGGATPV